MKTIKGKITISRSTSNVSGDYVSISIDLGDSVLNCKMDVTDYAYAVTGQARIPIEVRSTVKGRVKK